MVKYVQTELPKQWQKRQKVVRTETLPKDIKKLILSFVKQPQKLIPELLWGEFERQCVERNLCAGCGRGMDTNGCVCWGCNKYDTKNDINPRSYFYASYDKWDAYHRKHPSLPTQSLMDFYWVWCYTGCPTGFLYK